MDNVGRHTSQALNLDHPNVCVAYLPTKTTSLLQPMDMGVIKTLKCNYQRAVYREALKKMEEDSSMCMGTESTVSGCPFGVEDERNTRGSEKGSLLESTREAKGCATDGGERTPLSNICCGVAA